MRLARLLTLAAFAATLTACGMGGASEPSITEVAPAGPNTKMQFAVGIATISSLDGTSVEYGLNTVSTLRQSNGLSGALFTQPIIVGPTKFNFTPTSSSVWQYVGADLGTNHVTWASLNNSHWVGINNGIAQGSTGVFGYGLCPCDSNAGPAGGTQPYYQAMNLPIGGLGTGAFSSSEFFYGGPPAFPSIGQTLFETGFVGYSLGFTDFDVKPVVGAYHLYAAVPPAFTTPNNPTPQPGPNGTPTPGPGVLAATAQLTSLKPLPELGIPTFSPDGRGGGTATLIVPAGIHETMLVVGAQGCPVSSIACQSDACDEAHSLSSWYTIVTMKSGTQKLTLPDTIGPVGSNGQASATICPGETYNVFAAGMDYPAYESSYPQNLSERPHITGPNGQADVTTSGLFSTSYPTPKP